MKYILVIYGILYYYINGYLISKSPIIKKSFILYNNKNDISYSNDKIVGLNITSIREYINNSLNINCTHIKNQ